MSLAALAVAGLPWLQGFTDASVRVATPADPAWVATEDASCAAEVQAPLRLRADVAPAAGKETIVATLTGGIQVVSAEGIEIAANAGYPCMGSADELEVLAAGRVFDERTIVIAATWGGRREQYTWLGAYRVGTGGELDPLFAGVVETRIDGKVQTGAVTFLPGALIYRPPGRGDSLWVYDPLVHTYVPRGPFDREPEPHS